MSPNDSTIRMAGCCYGRHDRTKHSHLLKHNRPLVEQECCCRVGEISVLVQLVFALLRDVLDSWGSQKCFFVALHRCSCAPVQSIPRSCASGSVLSAFVIVMACPYLVITPWLFSTRSHTSGTQPHIHSLCFSSTIQRICCYLLSSR